MASLRFRPLTPEDLDKAAPLYQDGVEWMPFTVVHIPHQAAVQALCAPDSVWYVLVDGEKIVGLGGVERIRWIDGVGEPFISIIPSLRGNGVGQQLGEALKAVAFKQLNLRKGHTVILEDAPSRGILEKIGFVQEGVLKGMRMKDGKAVDGLAYGLFNTVKEGE